MWASRTGTRCTRECGCVRTEERVETLSNHALYLRRHACHAPPTLTRLSACLPLSFSLYLSLSYFLSFLLFLSLAHLISLLFSSHHFACESTDRQTGRSLVSYNLVSHRPSLTLKLLYRAVIHVSSLPPPILVRLSKKALHRLRIRRTA